MQTTDILQKDMVKTVSTKFYYKGNQMYYQIVVTYGSEDMHLFKDFDNYSEYQQYHDNLVTNLNAGTPIPNDFSLG